MIVETSLFKINIPEFNEEVEEKLGDLILKTIDKTTKKGASVASTLVDSMTHGHWDKNKPVLKYSYKYEPAKKTAENVYVGSFYTNAWYAHMVEYGHVIATGHKRVSKKNRINAGRVPAIPIAQTAQSMVAPDFKKEMSDIIEEMIKRY